MGNEIRAREAQRASAEGEDLDENEVAVGLTSSGGVPGRDVRARDSVNDRGPIGTNKVVRMVVVVVVVIGLNNGCSTTDAFST